MRAWVKPAAAVAGAVALIGGIALYIDHYTHGRFVQSTNDATIQADQVVISSKLAGYVRSVAVAENQPIDAGAPLLDIDPTDYRSRVASAEAGLAAALASGKTNQAEQAEAGAARDQAQAALLSAQAGLEFTERELVRFRPLVASGAEPDSVLSQLIANRDKSLADVTAQRAALRQASLRIATLGTRLGESQALADTARVQQAAATNDLSATHIVAPLAGRIANKSVRVGQYVQPGTRLLTVVPTDHAYVIANFKETQVGLMRPGQSAEIRVDALPGITFHGRVESITPGTGANFSLIPPQNATGNFTKIVQRVPVRIAILAGPAARKLLVPGLSIEVEVDTSTHKAELDAIRNEQERLGK